MPTQFTTQRSILRNLVLGGVTQTDAAQVLADTALTYRARPDTSGFFNMEPEVESDYEYAGKGTSFATESREIARSRTGDAKMRADDYNIGWLLAMVMGNDTITAPVDPETRTTHTITWRDTGDPAQVTNIYVEDAPGLKYKLLDTSCTKVVLSGTDKGSVQAQASFLSTGKYVDGAMAALPALPTAKYLAGSDSILKLGLTGAPASMAPRVLSWELTLDHANDAFRACGGGLYAYFIRYGNPVMGLKAVIAVDTTSDVRDWQVNRTELEAQLTIVSGTVSLTVDIPRLILRKADLGDTNKYVTYTIDLDKDDILKPSNGQICTATLLNTVATSYLTAYAGD